MICVAANNRTSLESIDKWRNEIQQVERQKPIMLILTKKDLIEIHDNPVTFDEVKAKSKVGYQGCSATSSKEWNDFNVHKAFNKVLQTAYISKYDA